MDERIVGNEQECVCVCVREAIITNEELIHISHCRSD